jgi:hypothetical protein
VRDEQLPIEVRQDPAALPGDLVGALATLLVQRARQVLARGSDSRHRDGQDRAAEPQNGQKR